MRSFERWILLVPLLVMFMAVVLDTESPHKAVPIIVLVVTIWAAWRMTAPGKRAGPVVSARDEAKHADVHDANDCAVHGNTIMAADSTVDTGAATQLYGDARPVRLADKEPITEDRKSAVLFFDGVPLPDDVHISPLSQAAPERHKWWLGAWVGAWNQVRDWNHIRDWNQDGDWNQGGDWNYNLDNRSSRHILVVEDIRANGEACVVSAHAENQEWERDIGEITGDTLGVSIITYKLIAPDRLLASFGAFQYDYEARMSKIELAELLRPGATIGWSGGVGVKFLDTDLIEGGKRVQLEVVIFKPKGLGPFPLLVFNHGRFFWKKSGYIPDTETHVELAEFFVEKGWMVAFPQRRGSGKSDGLYGEALVNSAPYYPREVKVVWDRDRSLSSAERALADIEAAIAALQRRPDVAGERVLIGGASGGGILSIAYAGLHPQKIAGVINFVGGWDGERSPWARQINGELFARGAAYDRETLWLYGRKDSVWSIAHSRSNYETFVKAGGKGEFFEFDVPGEENGHSLGAYPDLWREHLEKYLATLE